MIYEGATTGRRLGNWNPRQIGPNREIEIAIHKLRDRSRDLGRNNPYAARGISGIVNNVVGAGIIPKVDHPDAAIKAALETASKRMFDSRRIDLSDRHNMYGLQRLALRTIVESGACIIRRYRFRGRQPDRVLRVGVFEPDYLDRTKEGQISGSDNWIYQGVEVDKFGRIQALHLYNEHPSENRITFTLQSTRVPISDCRLIYREDRPGQIMGVPWLAPCMVALKDFAEYEDAQLIRQKIAACFAVFEVSPDMPSPATQSARPLERIEPGIYEKITPGKDIRFADPPGVEGYAEYSRAMLCKIAAGLGVPYELMTGDLSNVNFSSGRMGWLEFQRSVDAWQWDLMIPHMCDVIARWWLEIMAIELDVRDAVVTWTPPRREMISPKDEVGPQRDLIRMGAKTLSEVIRERGEDPETVFKERAEEMAALASAGIVSDADPAFDQPAQPAPQEMEPIE